MKQSGINELKTLKTAELPKIRKKCTKRSKKGGVFLTIK